MMLKVICSLGAAAALIGAPLRSPTIPLKDQFDRQMPSARSNTAILIYRSREASDRSLQEEREIAAAGKGLSVLRIIDISRAPFFVHGMITGSLRTSEVSNACYLDYDGKATLPFGVPDNGVGYFLYTNGMLASADTFVYSSNALRINFDRFRSVITKHCR